MWKYNNLNEVQLDLLKQNIIDLQGGVDSNMAFYVREAITRLISKGSPDITMHITSDGGDVTIALDIYDLLSNYSGEITGLVIGYARSMAPIILQACDIRVATKHSHILLHHINRSRITLDELINEKKIATIKKRMEQDQKKLNKILKEKTKKTPKTIASLCAKNIDISTKEALSFGLIDKIV